MLKVGITGGIGSGKSTVCRIFETLGIPVYDADSRAKALMTQHEPVRQKIISLFGEQAYLPDGSLHRALIAGRVFQDPDLLRQLNAIVHPAVAADGEQWHLDQKGVSYTLKEAALLFESGSYRLLDYTILVYAPAEVRLQRVMERDQVNREAVQARMNKQMPDEQRFLLADFVITNNERESLIRQVLEIHQKLGKLAHQKQGGKGLLPQHRN